MEKQVQDDISWSPDEMIQNAGDWSLAGDVKVLNYLKKFSEKVLTETVEISNNVDQQLNTLNEVCLKLDLVKNEFHSLRNSQFIESRVYEDDETVDDGNENCRQKTEETLTEEQKQERIKNAILRGVNAMKKYYDKVEVDVSDSEDDNERSYILKPKDLYTNRPLPYIVGTEEWHKKWHVGLLLSDSESETEKEADIYSSSDSENGLPKDRVPASETSSELSFSIRNVGPAANSTFNDTVDKRSDIFQSEENSYPAQAPISSQNFAEQLAEKLGNVISGDNSSNVNRNPSRKPTGTFFSDEPPPLDDLEDTILPKSAHSGLFSGGRDLFDKSDDDNPFWTPQNTTAAVKSKETGDHQNRTQTTKKGIFASSDDSSSEDDEFEKMFKKHQNPTRKLYLPGSSNIQPMFDNRPPEMASNSKENPSERKKPVGGVSIFGANIFGNDSPKNTLQAPKTQLEDTTKPENIQTHKQTLPKDSLVKNIKKMSLFDESDDEDILAEIIPSQKEDEVKKVVKKNWKKISLFDESDDEEIFAPSVTKKQVATVKQSTNTSKKLSLFDNEDSNLLATNKSTKDTSMKAETAKVNVSPKKANLFDNHDESYQDITKTRENISKESNNIEKKVTMFAGVTTVSESQNTSKIVKNIPNLAQKKISLFDSDCEDESNSKPSKKYTSIFDDEEDIFGNSDDIFSKKSTETKPIKNLFGDLNQEGSKNLFDILKKDPIPTTKNQTGVFDNLRSEEVSKNDDVISDKQIEAKTDTNCSEEEKTSDYPEKDISALDQDLPTTLKETITEDIEARSVQKSDFNAKLKKTAGLFDSSEESEEEFLTSNKKTKLEINLHSNENKIVEASSFVKSIDTNLAVIGRNNENNVLSNKKEDEANIFGINKEENLKGDGFEPKSDGTLKVLNKLVENYEEKVGETKKNINIFDSLHQDDDIPSNNQLNNEDQNDQNINSNENRVLDSDEDSIQDLSEKSIENDKKPHHQDAEIPSNNQWNDKDQNDENINSNEVKSSVSVCDEDGIPDLREKSIENDREDNKNLERYTSDLVSQENQPELEEKFTEIQSPCKEADFSDLSGPFQYPKINILESSMQERQPPPPRLIGLFDPNPPPMDEMSNDDSSDGFDSSSINDDFSHEPIGHQRSGIFDNEPPLLNPNESSGIVRDQNVTRVDTDDSSSFYPYASSSRRFSSDIFNEQESQDNLFITKNQSENSFSGLQKIPEDEKTEDSMSKMDITPSGNINDFLSSSSVFDKTETSVKDKNDDTSDTPKSKKIINIFATSDEENDDFLFNSIKKSSLNTSSVIGNSAKTLSANSSALSTEQKSANMAAINNSVSKLKTDHKMSADEVDKEIQTNAKLFFPTKTLAENLEDTHRKSQQTQPKMTSPPNKLKHNLQINVDALLPGAARPKLKGAVKSVSFEDTSVTKVAESVDFEHAEDKTVENKSVDDGSGILKSVTKDRARIPVRRRPSTRKGRQESIRNSIADFRLYQGNDDSTETENSEHVSKSETDNHGFKIPDSKNKDGYEPKRVSLVFDKTNHSQNEEIIKNDSLRHSELSKSYEKNVSIYKVPPKSSIFDDGSSSDNEDLFKTTPSASKTNQQNSENTLKSPAKSFFSDHDEQQISNTDLFGSSSISENIERKNVTEKPKKSLFDSDGDSDNDLFTVKQSDSKSSTKPVEQRSVKTAAVKKLETKKVANDDPLQGFR